MPDEEERAEEETIIVPAEATPPEPEVEEEEEDELKDLFEVPQPEDNDMRTDIALDFDEEDIIGGDSNMSDLVDVPEEDIMGEPESEEAERPVVKKKKYRIVRPIRREPPPTSVGGIRR